MRLFDLHCDTVTECLAKKKKLAQNDLAIDLDRGMAFERWIQTYAFWIDDQYRGEDAFAHCMEQLRFLADIVKTEERLVRYAGGGQPHPEVCEAIFAIEGGAALAGKLENIGHFRSQGVRMMTLCWNGENELASGAKASGGLKPFGRLCVAEMERLGMIVDVSHLNDESFWGVERAAQKPFVATHSNARAICPHPRNLTDDQLRVMIERGGLIGMNFYTLFLNEREEEASAQDVIRHIEHILSLGGEDVLALGSDFDGASMPVDLKSIKSIENLHILMVQCLGTAMTEKIMYGNAERFFRTHWRTR